MNLKNFMILNLNINKSYIVAEAGVNHNGRYAIAKKLIKKASICGANAVKFQIFNANDLLTSKARMAPYQAKNIKTNIEN